MTHRIDREDAYQRELRAKVVTNTTFEGRPAVLLDQSLFYATGGGQSADQGRLWPASYPEEAVSVLDVVSQGDEVLHILEKPLSEKAKEVEGAIDWVRRFDHMQQHTGQHVLSAALYRLMKAETRSARLGVELDTIDLDRELSPQALKEAEELANQIVGEDRGVAVSWPSPELLASLPLRREPKVDVNVRVVEVDGFDLSPCGGTHVKRSSEIGAICVASTERYKGGTRVHFLCGRRVISAFRARRVEGEQLAKLLSAPPGEQANAVTRLLSEAQARLGRIEELTALLAKEKAEALLAGSQTPLLRLRLSADKALLRAIAQRVSQEPRRAAFLGAIEGEGEEARGVLLFAAGPESGVDAGARLKTICAKLGGRGGGRPNLAEGSCPKERLDQALSEA